MRARAEWEERSVELSGAGGVESAECCSTPPLRRLVGVRQLHADQEVQR